MAEKITNREIKFNAVLWQQKSRPKDGFVEMIHVSAVLGSYRSSFHTLMAEIEDKLWLVL
jgi:hypothetical protein